MSAHAGIAGSNATKMATAAIVSNTTTFARPAALSYQTSATDLLAANTVYYVYVKLAAGVFTGAPAATLFTSGSAVLSAALIGATASQLSTDGTFAVYTLASLTGAVAGGTTISLSPTGTGSAAGGMTGLLATAAAGGSVVESLSIGSTLSLATPQADVDAAAGAAVITFVPAQTYLSVPSSATQATWTGLGVTGTAPETAQINVSTGTGVGLTAPVMTAATLLDFGGFVFTDVTGVTAADGVSTWLIANEYTAASMTATVTGNFAAESSMFLSTNPACTVVTTALTVNTAKTSATLAAGRPAATAVGDVVCMAINGTTVIPSTTPAINITLSTPAGASIAGTPVSFGPSNLYALTPNGGSAIVRTYIPSAATGYTDYVRVINTGSASSTISVARIDPVTGVIGTAATLPGGAVAPGSATIYSSTQIDTALGGPGATATSPLGSSDRPRLQFNATTGISVQNFIYNPTGTLSTLHGTE